MLFGELEKRWKNIRRGNAGKENISEIIMTEVVRQLKGREEN